MVDEAETQFGESEQDGGSQSKEAETTSSETPPAVAPLRRMASNENPDCLVGWISAHRDVLTGRILRLRIVFLGGVGLVSRAGASADLTLLL